MKAKEIRSRFLAFFAERGHRVVSSSTLVPRDDPTLLFTNAGMNQFKSVFLGLEKRDYVRAASVQKCMRVSGKHNDLEEVGKDARHHTFFEMLGNWSFGDYYKRESIEWGWQFLTGEMELPADKLWASVYKDDDEAHAIFTDVVGLPAERVVRLGDIAQGDEENFWSMADTGPCGPCAEMHIDQGEAMQCDHPDGCALGVCDCDRWLELWNHVFMEFDRDETGKLTPLPMKSVDTGLGFERLVAVKQGVTSNYDSDLFTPLIERVAELCGKAPEGPARVSMQVIADHARAVTFTITDGAVPANEGRGYVVRRILRRAARHGHLLELEEPFLYRIAEVVIDTMGDAYPELRDRRDRTVQTIRREEERFQRTLAAGLSVYADYRERMRRDGRTELRGEEAFKLHDTFGFPVDLTAVVAEEDGFTVDVDGFAVCMAKQRQQSGAERVFRQGIGAWQTIDADFDLSNVGSRFVGYEHLGWASRPLAVRSGGEDPDGAPLTQLLFAETPFYGEAGGQVGDRGRIVLPPGAKPSDLLDVVTTVAAEEGPACVVVGDSGELLERLRAAGEVQLLVDPDHRLPTMRHHTATHLLHTALRRVLGDHVEQAGSEVSPQRLRFDFRHDEALTAEQIARVEALLNEQVLANRPVLQLADVPLAEAKQRGAMALFGEKYDDTVRMIEIHSGFQLTADLDDDAGPVFSLELCGGTHCLRTGDVGYVRILNEGSVAAGVRRVEAIAGAPAQGMIAADRQQLQQLAAVLRPDGDAFADQVQSLTAERDQLRKQLAQLQQQSAQDALSGASADAVTVGDVKVVAARVEADGRDALMKLGDHVRDKLDSGVVVLAAAWEGKATVIATVTADLVAAKRLHAGNLVKSVATAVGGRGGGRPNMAQAGLPDVDTIESALATVVDLVRQQLDG